MVWFVKGAARPRMPALALAFTLIVVQGIPCFAQEAPANPAETPADSAPAPAVTAPSSGPGDAASPAGSPASPTPAASEAPVPAGDAATAASETPPPAEQAGTASARDETLPHDLSPWGMYQAADIVVKAVMIGLAFASLVTWTVAIAKFVEIACARARASRARTKILSAGSLDNAVQALSGRGGPAAFMVRTADNEMQLSETALDRAGAAGLKERIASHLADIEARAGRRLNTGTGVLATIGSTAPFVGLFGTVWGIMNSFIGISEAQTTNLAIVAPGIAEALLATAIGLVAAIPAVIIYNVFARQIAGYRHLLREAGTGVERLVSRDLDLRTAGRAQPRQVAAE